MKRDTERVYPWTKIDGLVFENDTKSVFPYHRRYLAGKTIQTENITTSKRVDKKTHIFKKSQFLEPKHSSPNQNLLCEK